VIREERRRKIEEYIAAGRQEGATLATGGGRPPDLSRGWFLQPTVFCNVPNTIRIAREEIFGPVVAVLPFADEDDAIRIANDSTYGLGGAIYSHDTSRALALAKRIRTGVVWINNGINFLDAPFGGFKESGIGREGGRFGLEEYTEIQQIAWRA
jgi:acyl-CoA reductase-like NAD-dependent aldehyde dehydrogenase